MQVGVVIPVHGFSPYLVQTLEAVLDQEDGPVEVVVVDDGSPRPLTLPDGIQGRVALLRRDACGGPGAARNAGVRAFSDAVDHVAFCDHDDVWQPGYLAAHERAAAHHPSATILSGEAIVVGPDDRPTGEHWEGLHPGGHRPWLVLPTIYERHPLCTSATIVRREAFAGVDGFDESLGQAEDLDLWLRLLERDEQLVSVLGATARYRRHPSGLTHDLVALADDLLRVHRAHAAHVREPVARRAEAADLRRRAAGLTRLGRYDEARREHAAADELLPPLLGDRLHSAVLAVPGLRTRCGQRRSFAG